MLSSLADPILPIFAILGLGFLLFKIGIFDVGSAQAINKFVFYVATPALIFFIVSNAPVTDIDILALGIYFIAQLIVYVGTFLLTHLRFGVEQREAILLGMTAVLVNHVFFVLPIAERLYGATAAQPIAGIVLVDVVIVFCGTVLTMDLIQTRQRSPVLILCMLAKNPFLIAVFLGIAAWYVDPVLPSGIYTYAEFAGAAAAPASLFSLGVILASSSLRPIGKTTWWVVAVKILIHPLLVFAFSQLFVTASGWDHLVLLVAAGPCGAMPFVIALQYSVRTQIIAKAILISTVLSLISLSLLTG